MPGLRRLLAALGVVGLCTCGATPLAEERARALLFALSGDDAEAAGAAAREITDSGDVRFVAAFVELLRADALGIGGAGEPSERVEALRALGEKIAGAETAETLGGDWPAWVEWYAGTDLEPPPGFTGWKGDLLGRIDPNFGALLRDEHPSRVRVEEIVWGGVRYEGIPALDRPATVAADDARWLEPGEPVFGIEMDGDARAYPLRILDWHEMVNDVVGGVPVSLAYCTLCGAGIAYDGRAPDGRTYDFGSSGLLMRSNKLMVDRQTRTLWNQFTGRPVQGPLAGASDLRLEKLPVVVSTWRDWREAHPTTRVLSLETGHRRPYLPGAAYGGYFASPDLMFPVPELAKRLPRKARIFGLELGGVPKAYAVEDLVAARVVNDRVGDTPVALVAQRGRISVEGSSLRAGPVAYDAGAEVRAYARGERRFSPGAEPGIALDALGRPWRVEESALVGPDGERAPRLAGHLAYWFGWSAYHPRTLLWDAESAKSGDENRGNGDAVSGFGFGQGGDRIRSDPSNLKPETTSPQP